MCVGGGGGGWSRLAGVNARELTSILSCFAQITRPSLLAHFPVSVEQVGNL